MASHQITAKLCGSIRAQPPNLWRLRRTTRMPRTSERLSEGEPDSLGFARHDEVLAQDAAQSPPEAASEQQSHEQVALRPIHSCGLPGAFCSWLFSRFELHFRDQAGFSGSHDAAQPTK